MIHIGTAAWSIPQSHKTQFDEKGSHLERYSQRLTCVEINSSFYREHQLKTYLRWAASTPDSFRFTVKLSREFTHAQALDVDLEEFQESLQNIFGLGDKLGAILVQLPGKQQFNLKTANRFFTECRRLYEGALVIEPRNHSWTSPAAVSLYRQHRLSKVISDPEKCMLAGDRELTQNLVNAQVAYIRLHGSPMIYTSSYPPEFLQELSNRLRNLNFNLDQVYCIFDNTKYGHSVENAFTLKHLVADSSDRPTGKRPRLESPTLNQL